MTFNKKRGNNKKYTNRLIEEELKKYNDSKPIRIETAKVQFENMHYYSQKERNLIESKFVKPRNQSQLKYFHELQKSNNKIIIATGPAGTGKTLFATEYGIKQFLSGKYEKLVFTRPAVSADEDLGFLPGTLEDKMAPWIRPIYDILYKFVSPAEVSMLIEEKIIEIAPLAYMRGRTFKNTWLVADEMQNSLPTQLKMLMTRLGENSRMVITGDLDQHDRIGEVNGLEDFLYKFKGRRSDSITSVEFHKNDIEREEVIKEILDIYAGVIPDDYIHTPTSYVSSISDSDLDYEDSESENIGIINI